MGKTNASGYRRDAHLRQYGSASDERGKKSSALLSAQIVSPQTETRQNKIGTYGVAILAEAHGIPFYVAVPDFNA